MSEKSKIDYSLSDQDVMDIVDEKSKVVAYRDLHKYRSLDELLSPHGAVFILYETEQDYGHWVSLIKSRNIIEFFDPYGVFIDDELKWIPKKFAKESHQDKKYLSQLLYESPYKLSYNEYPFQKLKNGINTCGRWAAQRIIMKNTPLEQFNGIFDSDNKDSDKIITELTSIDLVN